MVNKYTHRWFIDRDRFIASGFSASAMVTNIKPSIPTIAYISPAGNFIYFNFIHTFKQQQFFNA